MSYKIVILLFITFTVITLKTVYMYTYIYTYVKFWGQPLWSLTKFLRVCWLKPSSSWADIALPLPFQKKKSSTLKISICNRFKCLLPKEHSLLSSCFTNSYFEIKLGFTPVEKKFFFYQSKWASLGHSQSQTSWQYLIKQTSCLIPPVSQRLRRWGRGIILEVSGFCWLFTFVLKCLEKFHENLWE